MAVWTKQQADAPLGAFEAEAAGLDWLRVTGGPHIPDVIDVTPTALRISLVERSAPTEANAVDFGQRLAVLHRTGAPAFGASWPGFIGPVHDLLPLDNAPDDSWAEHFRERRVLPVLREAVRRGRVEDPHAIEHVLSRLDDLVPPEDPARLHGDLWNGNVLWSASGVWLIDPAAHGGHRETDLAMLALFGLPHLDRVLSAYDETWPLSDGWRERVALHQLWPLLVHTALFGGSYGQQALAAARRYT